jgi:GR25 family glycosyltransferase involved in LPS biosynthesis
MDFRGFYINLDRSAERRRKLDANLASLGLAPLYERLPAVDARAVGIQPWEACYRSHIKALERGVESGAPVIHVIEDDVIPTSHVAPFIRSEAAGALTQRFDLLFLDMWVDPERIAAYRDAFLAADPTKGYHGLSVIDLSEQRVATTASYLVRREAISRILALLKEWLPRGNAIDATLTRIVSAGDLKAGVVVPFLTGMDAEGAADSTIQSLPAEESRMLSEIRAQFCIV